MTLLPK